MQVFSSKVFYNKDTSYFEQVLGGDSGIDGVERVVLERREGRGSLFLQSAVLSTTSMSSLYLTDDFVGHVRKCTSTVLTVNSLCF